MKRLLLFLTAFWVFIGLGMAYGAEAKKPAPKAKPAQEVKSFDTIYHALIIGNNQYKYLPKLKTARNDALEVEKILREKFRFQTKILLDATRANILGNINEMRKRLGENDSLLIYYAGHGEYDKNVDKAYWLPVDAQSDDPTNWIMAEDITSNIKRLSTRHVLVVSDSCYSGTLSRLAVTEIITTGEREGYLKKMQDRPSRTLMASGGNEPVSDSGGGNNSVFAAAFIKALQESDKANFTAEEIFHSRIKAIVAGKSDQVPEYKSLKNSGDEGGDFVFRLAKLNVEPLKTATDIKVQGREEDKQYDEERDRVEADKKRLKEEIKLEKERAKVAEEKALWEAKKKEAEVKKPVLFQPFSELLSLIPEFTISQPGPTDPPEVKALLGIWTGKFHGPRDTILIISSIDIDKKLAKVIYAWGDSPPNWKIQVKKGYYQIVANFVPGEKPILKWEVVMNNSPNQMEFVLKKDKLEGSSWFQSSTNWVTMTKAP